MENCSNSKSLSTTTDVQEEAINLSTTKSSVDDNIEDNISISSNNTSNDCSSSISENDITSSSTSENVSFESQIKRKRISNLKENDAMKLLKKMPQKTLLEICKYRPNMIRNVPAKKRSPKDQKRRNNNTIACRKSRRVKKLRNMVNDEKYKLLNEQYQQILREKTRVAHYVNSLLKCADSQLKVMEKNKPPNFEHKPVLGSRVLELLKIITKNNDEENIK